MEENLNMEENWAFNRTKLFGPAANLRIDQHILDMLIKIIINLSMTIHGLLIPVIKTDAIGSVIISNLYQDTVLR